MPSKRVALIAAVVLAVAPYVGAQAIFSGAATTSTPPGTATDPGMKWYVDNQAGSDTNNGNQLTLPFRVNHQSQLRRAEWPVSPWRQHPSEARGDLSRRLREPGQFGRDHRLDHAAEQPAAIYGSDHR